MKDSLHAIWVDPLAFNPDENGPPYMPEKTRSASTKTARDVGGFVASLGSVPMGELSALLAVLRAAAMMHQTHHWQTLGSNFYGDHLLFERLYNESVGFIDQIAERAVGLAGGSLVSVTQQALLVQGIITSWSKSESSDLSAQLVSSSLEVETDVIRCVHAVITSLDSKGMLTDGTSNLLEGVADKHEEFLYLLKQRSTATKLATYDRRR